MKKIIQFISQLQSRNEVNLLTLMLGSEMKDNMVHLGENQNFLNGLAINTLPVDPFCKPFAIHHKGDMSLQL
jgi:hypothetical protein